LNHWYELTHLGGIVVTGPIALAVFVWLALGHATRQAMLWCLLFCGGMAVVVFSKLLFLGWGIGIRSLDFTGFSGHAMRSAAVYPVLFYLIFVRAAPTWRGAGIALGSALALAIGYSRLVVHAHSVSEVIVGCLLGAAVSGAFIASQRHTPVMASPRWIVAAGLVILLAAPRLPAAPTERWMEDWAQAISGHSQPFIRQNWKMRGISTHDCIDCKRPILGYN
jgi:hypothetical protein